MGKIINFNGVTFGEIDPDKVLDAAKGKLSAVIIIGTEKNGNTFWVSTSSGDTAQNNLLIDMAKDEMLSEMNFEDDNGA